MKAIKAAQRSDTSSRNFVSTTKDPTRVPAAIANQTRHQDDQDAAEPFVKRFARAALNVTRLGTASAGRLAPHSHSIINEPSKLLICNAPEAAPPKFTVIFTVKVRSAGIGAGFRPVLRKLTFRDLSRTIDSWVARDRFTGALT